MDKNNQIRTIEPKIIAAPKIRQIYWCDFWADAISPEMHKKRPVIIISRNNNRKGACLVVPISTADQRNSKWSYELTTEIEPGRMSWAVCNHINTVSTSRLSQAKGNPRISEDEIKAILALVHAFIPSPID